MTVPAPYDGAAEQAVIGDMLSLPDAIEPLMGELEPGDFYDQACATAFGCLVDGWLHGALLDATALRSAMAEAGKEPSLQWLIDVQSAGSGAYMANAAVVNRYRIRRQIIEATLEAAQAARTDADPEAVFDHLQRRLDRVEHATGAPPRDCRPLDDYLDENVDHLDPWVVPGLFRKDWRVMIVAHEGAGKSVLLRQIAIAASQGFHPLHVSSRIEPIRVLLVDLENPMATIVRGCRHLRAVVAQQQPYETGRVKLWARRQGVNVRSTRGRRELERAIRDARPDLVALGPLYKSFRRSSRESDEDAVAEVQVVFDDLRTRFGFALLLEHHAPQFIGGSRNLRPFGSSLWLRWPELGMSFERDDKHRDQFEVEHWRGPRDGTHAWPERIDHGQPGSWPWVGWWPDSGWHDELF